MNLAIISPNKSETTETFIKAHKELLNGNKKYLFGGFFPTLSEDGLYNLYAPKSLWGRVSNKLISYLSVTANHPLEQYLLQQKIHVVLAEYGPTGAEVMPICKKLNIPLIVQFLGFDATNRDVMEQYRDKYLSMFEYASYLLVVSELLKENLVGMGAPANKIINNPCGPDPDFFDISPNFQSNTFFAMGRFVDKKAPYLTLWAFKKVLEKKPEMRLVMAGDGPLLFMCQNLAKAWNITHAVTFKGAVTHQEDKELMAQSFCFIQHSITSHNGDSEGTPVAILEAGASGLPVVATKHSGIIETVLHGQTGYLVNETDVNEMVNCMIQLSDNRELCQELGNRARVHVHSNFSNQKHIELIDQLVSGL